MKKFALGIILSTIGFIYSFACFVYTILNPCIVNGQSGLIVSFRENDVLLPFLISILILVIGVLICGYEAYRKTYKVGTAFPNLYLYIIKFFCQCYILHNVKDF